MVIEKIKPGSYRLTDPQGLKLEHSWNADNLCHFYI
jgi:hypothetical protein